MRERNGTILTTRSLTRNVTLVAISPQIPQTVHAKAGQFVSLRTPSGTRHSYSIISEPGRRDHFELVLKSASRFGDTAAMTSGTSGFKPGDPVYFFGPMGYFLYQDSHDGEAFFGATGIGISAILPMLREALNSKVTRVTLWWGLRDVDDFFFADRLDALTADPRFHYHLVLSKAGDGYITKPLIQAAQSANNPRIYLCGHGQMISDISLALPNHRDRIHTETFHPASINRRDLDES